MTHGLRFQVLVIPNVPWSEYLDRFMLLDGLGIDVAAVPDHFCDWTNRSGPWLECWTALAAIAARTSNIRLTTCVTQIPLRNPAVLAHQAVTVDHISGGRLEIGLGTGLTIDPSYDMAGLANWSTGERAARFGEYVDLLVRLLTDDTTTFQGRYYQASEAVMNPSSFQRPHLPIMVAALGPRMMSHAARHADIWNSLSFATEFADQLTETRARCGAMDEICTRVGREPASLRRSYTMYDATARANGGAIRYYESEDAFTEMVGQVIELGMTEVSLYYPALEAQLPMFERIATSVLPRLRAGHA